MVQKTLLTVVIPTYKRSNFLVRAIESALDCSDLGFDIEVLVIPNGPDLSWKEIESKYLSDNRVKFFYCEKGHANAARNLGLLNAGGEYIRFLDDDDFFDKSGTIKLLNKIHSGSYDIVSGRIAALDESFNLISMCSDPRDKNSFFNSAIFISGITLPLANIYRVSILNKLKIRWDETVPKAQDLAFHLDILLVEKSLNWFFLEETVGYWYQHDGERISVKTTTNIQYMHWIVERLEKLQNKYIEDVVVYKALWQFVEFHFYNHRNDCLKLVKKLKKIKHKEKGLSERFFNNKKLIVVKLINYIPLIYLHLLTIFKYVNSKFKNKKWNNVI